MVVTREGDEDNRSLVERIREGCREAEREFASCYEGRVRLILLARTRNPDLARDLTQDVLIEALRALRQGRLENAGNLPAFLHGIARNLLACHGRGTVRRREVPLDGDFAFVASPDRDAEEAERQERLRVALDRLAPNDRAILTWILAEGLSISEIARRSGLSADVVRQRKSRALKRIREALAAGREPGRGAER